MYKINNGFELVYIDDRYTDYLHKYGDTRVSYNNNLNYQRPYVGILFSVKGKQYFAPLTTSAKGEKLFNKPKKENITFWPIDDCRYGGINFNNMIPVVEGVYKHIQMDLCSSDFDWERRQKIRYMNIRRILRKEQEYLTLKAKKLYNHQIAGTLLPHYQKITCDFKKLEAAAGVYKKK